MSVDEPLRQGSVSLLTAASRARLVLAGDVDESLAADMAEAVLEAGSLGVTVEVDTRAVTFMDSAGVAQLARLVHQLKGRRVVFIAPTDVVRFLLDVTTLAASVDILEVDPGFPEDTPADRLAGRDVTPDDSD